MFFEFSIIRRAQINDYIGLADSMASRCTRWRTLCSTRPPPISRHQCGSRRALNRHREAGRLARRRVRARRARNRSSRVSRAARPLLSHLSTAAHSAATARPARTAATRVRSIRSAERAALAHCGHYRIQIGEALSIIRPLKKSLIKH